MGGAGAGRREDRVSLTLHAKEGANPELTLRDLGAGKAAKCTEHRPSVRSYLFGVIWHPADAC